MSTILGIISDTHGNIPACRLALKIFQEHGVQEILHCGDVGTVEIVEILSALPTHYVFGNTDSRGWIRRAILDCGQTCYESVGMMAREGRQIAFLHGDDWRTFDDLLHCGRFDLICCGHTHEYEWRIEGEKTHVLNPGALYRTKSPSVAMVELPSLRVRKESVR
ncbi:MAG: YfcE family phosphodiesterase [Planctomycetia bacterium]|nr:YfcE family phosphodiesterase [Planctomycetia bacterium]